MRCTCWILFVFLGSLLLDGVLSQRVFAHSEDSLRGELNLPRKKVSVSSNNSSASFSKSKTSTITLEAAPSYVSLGSKLVEDIQKTDEEYQMLFGGYQPVGVHLKLVESEDFYRSTHVPRWTNALFLKGKIVIPIDQSQEIDHRDLARSIRHEYTHAIVNTLSAGRCPGWIDEGLAQLLEGSENPALRTSIKEWLRSHPIISFALLQGGFTRLEASMVAPAYAQSLYATKILLNRYGFHDFRVYLDLLRSSPNRADLFQEAFGISEMEFQRVVQAKLQRDLGIPSPYYGAERTLGTEYNEQLTNISEAAKRRTVHTLPSARYEVR